MVYAAMLVFSVICAGAAVILLLVRWELDEEQIHVHVLEHPGVIGEIRSQPPTIERIQEHVDAQMVGLDEFSIHPSAESLYSARGESVSAA